MILRYSMVLLPSDDCEQLLSLVTQLEADVARNREQFGTTNVPDRLHAIGALTNKLRTEAVPMVIPLDVQVAVNTD